MGYIRKLSDDEQQYLDESKNRLEKILTTKMKTIMVGAVNEIEKNLGFLFGYDENGVDKNEPLSPEEQIVYDAFIKLRSKIFDLGNTQIRNMSEELSRYTIKWLRYHLNLEVRPEGIKNAKE